jgi:hypothetical protein
VAIFLKEIEGMFKNPERLSEISPAVVGGAYR